MSILKQILAFVFAGYFLLASTGFNIARYCCDGCADAGISLVAEKSCHAIHRKKEQTSTTCCIKSSSEQCSEMSDDCEFLRIQTDIPSLVVNTTRYDSEPEFLSTCTNFFLCVCNKHIFSTAYTVFFLPDKKVLHSGRDILTMNAVLIC